MLTSQLKSLLLPSLRLHWHWHRRHLATFLPESLIILFRHKTSVKMTDVSLENYSTDRKQDERKSDEITCEGKAAVYLPTSVFYNPVQEFNRDLTIAVITQYVQNHFRAIHQTNDQNKEDTAAEDITVKIDSDSPYSSMQPGKVYDDGIIIMEGLAASGLRSVRFALEIPGIKQIVTNDFSKAAVELIKKNAKHNDVESLITPSLDDAAMALYRSRRLKDRFDIIDLDPYGSPAVFLDAAVQAVKDGGILCVTCTDMAILCGNHPETCFAKYGAVPLRTKACHEMALRLVLQCIENHANRYSRYIIPLISVSADFYVRVFVRVMSGQSIAVKSIAKKSMVYHCVGCGTISYQPLGKLVATKGNSYTVHPARGPPVDEHCKHCNQKHQIGGPIWSDPIHDLDFVRQVLQGVQNQPQKFGTAERIMGMMNVILEELPDVPLYYILDDLCSRVHCTAPSLIQFRSALLNAGYKVSLSHAARNSQKTSAPMTVLWDIFRCWCKDHPVHEKHLKDGSTAKNILAIPAQLDANFAVHPEANPESREKGLLRWQINPDKNWGPAARACSGLKVTLEERRQQGIEKAKERKKRKKMEEDPNFKQFECKRHKKGRCNKGDDCMYSHEIP